ncbi:tetratricopeptide (TPR) repeat protein [Rhodanobacter sp. TND4EL1]
MTQMQVHPLLRDRAVGLPLAARQRYDEATIALARRDLDVASEALSGLRVLAPDFVEARRLQGLVTHMRGDHAAAVAILREALAAHPDNALLHMNLGMALYGCGEFATAFSSLRRACELAPDFAPAWFSLGRAFQHQGRSAGAITALHRAVDLAPEDAVMRSLLAEAQASLGAVAAACTNYREALRHEPDQAEAWLGLARMQGERFTHDDLSRLKQAMQRPSTSSQARVMLGFALSRCLEDQGDYHAAFRALRKANGQARKQVGWNAAVVSARVAGIRAAFAQPSDDVEDPGLGGQVIFIAGLPRAGGGLLRRVLAGHAQVDASDRPQHLREVIEEESKRRQQGFPQWTLAATPADWARLGREYLARAIRTPDDKRWFIDQSDQDWHLMDAAMAMLPGARLVDCRRDALENCFSCYRQLFARAHEFSYDLDELASFWRDYDGLATPWQQLYHGRVFVHQHESLLADPPLQLHRLLAFLGLDEDRHCLDVHANKRQGAAGNAVRLRGPLRWQEPRAPRYASKLDRLRVLLGLR